MLRDCLASADETQKSSRGSFGAYQTGDAQGSPSASAVPSVMNRFDSNRSRHRAEIVLFGHVRLARVVFVVAAEPVLALTLLLAPARRAVQEPVIGHRRLEAPRGRDVRPVDAPVRERVRAEAGALGDVAGDVRAARACHLLDGRGDLAFEKRSE